MTIARDNNSLWKKLFIYNKRKVQRLYVIYMLYMFKILWTDGVYFIMWTGAASKKLAKHLVKNIAFSTLECKVNALYIENVIG